MISVGSGTVSEVLELELELELEEEEESLEEEEESLEEEEESLEEEEESLEEEEESLEEEEESLEEEEEESRGEGGGTGHRTFFTLKYHISFPITESTFNSKFSTNIDITRDNPHFNPTFLLLHMSPTTYITPPNLISHNTLNNSINTCS